MWEYWPTAWFFVVPVMMLACMAVMFFMMRGMRGCCHAKLAGTDINVAPNSPHFPQGPSPFEEYRAETLRRLDQEQQEFQDFVARLRSAKDKAEFDEFMARRRVGTTSSN